MTSVSNIPQGQYHTFTGNYPLAAPIASSLVKMLPSVYLIARETGGYYANLKLKEANILQQHMSGIDDENKKKEVEELFYQKVESARNMSMLFGNKSLLEQADDILLERQRDLLGGNNEPITKEEQQEKDSQKFEEIDKQLDIIDEGNDTVLEAGYSRVKNFVKGFAKISNYLFGGLSQLQPPKNEEYSNEYIEKAIAVINTLIRNGFSIEDIDQHIQTLKSEGAIKKTTENIMNDALLTHKISAISQKYQNLKATASRKQILSLQNEISKIDLGSQAFYKKTDMYQKKKILELDIKAQLNHMRS